MSTKNEAKPARTPTNQPLRYSIQTNEQNEAKNNRELQKNNNENHHSIIYHLLNLVFLHFTYNSLIIDHKWEYLKEDVSRK